MSSKAWRPIWIMTLMSLACLGAVVGTLRAFAQEPPTRTQQRETGPIRDDATVAPDELGSADNNVTFPTDI